MYHCFTCLAPVIFPKCKLHSAKNIQQKWYHIGLPKLKVGFNDAIYLSNLQIFSLQIPIASLIPNKGEWNYRGRTISIKQSNKTLHHSSTSTEQVL